MRILIDECIDERFRNGLPGHIANNRLRWARDAQGRLPPPGVIPSAARDLLLSSIFISPQSPLITRDSAFLPSETNHQQLTTNHCLYPPRHFERSRPTFSSAFAPAKASACECEKSLFRFS